MSFRPCLPAFAMALALLLSGALRAQETAAPLLVPDAQRDTQPGEPQKQGFHLRLGAGGLITPDYTGSKSYLFQPLPYVDATYGEVAALSYQDGLTVNAVHLGDFTAGPVARLRFGRSVSDNRTVLRGLGDIGPSVELGGFAAYDAGPINLRGIVAQDVAGGHKGLVAEFGASYTRPVFATAAGPWLLIAGPSLTVVDGQYNRSVFGINASQSKLSGRSIFRPGGGLEGAGFSTTLVVPITEKIAVTALAGYDRLLSDAARSPIVRNGVGSANQFTGGLFLTYQFF